MTGAVRAAMRAEPPVARGPRLFARLGRFVVRHPWYVISFWIALLLVAAPFLQFLGSITTNSTTTLPASSPSSLAQAEFNRLFPNDTGGGSSYLLFTAPNMTDAHAQAVLGNVTRALINDSRLSAVASIDSIYTDYARYVAGDVEIGAVALQAALGASPSLPQGINETANLTWGPPGAFVTEWENRGANTTANYPAYVATQTLYHASPAAQLVLQVFYYGAGSDGKGFNGSLRCAEVPSAVVACSDQAVWLNVPSILPQIFPPDPESQAIAQATVGYLELENFTQWSSIRFAAAEVLGGSTGLSPQWFLTVWDAFPYSVPSPDVALAWATGEVARATLWTEPLPVPAYLLSQYVSPGRHAQLIIVSFSRPDDYVDANGNSPVYADIDEINSLVPSIVHASDPTRSISFVQTGSSPLDQAQQNVINAAIALVLPLTVVVLILITALYFRSPLTPLVAFSGLAVALVLGLGGTVLLGSLVTHVDTTSLTLEEVFVLGVGTDYSIFLISRYREELAAGTDPREAVVTSVTWAGQSVATSGTTAVIATLALTFSGIALLSQWGMVLSLAVLITILLSLTMIPALLTLVGPRVFWPYSGERFRRLAQRQQLRADQRSTYFRRVASLTRRRPLAVVAIILLVTAPLVWVALSVPISYDFYDQLPASQPAVAGLGQLAQQFGPGFAFPTTALVTFASPLLQGNQTNATEFAYLAGLTSLGENTSGVALVQSLVGPYGAPLATWQNLSVQPVATQVHLMALAGSFVGTDDRTVLVVLQMNESGLSQSAITTLNAVGTSFSGYADTRPAITHLAYLGGASVTNDLATQSALATQRLLLAVAAALVVVLFVVLRSWIIPLLAVATIGLSIAWSWGLTYLVLGRLFSVPILFFVPTLMFILILGLGIDYNIFLLSRVREERLRGRSSPEAVEEGLARTGGIITAAAVILAGAFATLLVGSFSLLVAIGFSVAAAVLLDALVVRTFLVPSLLQLLDDRVWRLSGRRGSTPAAAPPSAVPGPPSTQSE